MIQDFINSTAEGLAVGLLIGGACWLLFADKSWPPKA